MKFKALLTAVCCVLLLSLSTVTAFAVPDDNSYLDDIYDWVSSTVSDIADNYSSAGDETQSGGDYNDGENPDNTSSENTSHENETQYYEPTEPTYYEATQTQEESVSSETSSNWYDWFSVSRAETQPETETLPPDNAVSSSSGTTEYVGYGLFLWAVIIVGVLLTLGIITNTHIRKKS